MKAPQFTINGYELHGGGMCPEQYDVYKDGKEVGYLRLRHGWFYAQLDFHNDGPIVYEAQGMDGDGCFSNTERMSYLTAAIEAIDKHLSDSTDEPSIPS